MSLWRHLHLGLRSLLIRRRGAHDEVAGYFAETAAAAGPVPGDEERVRDQLRAYGWENSLDALWSDVRFATRRLAHSPAFTLTAVLILALGIGVATAMYSVLDTVFLQPLPYAQPQRLLKLELPHSSPYGGQVLLPNVLAWQARASDFSAIAFVDGPVTTLELPNRTDFIENIQASPNLLATLGVRPMLGRAFGPGDAHAQVAILTHALWRSEFDARRDIIGRQIRLGGKAYTVIGVLAPGVSFPLDTATLMTPYLPPAKQLSWSTADDSLEVIGRLRAGVTPAAAQAQLRALQASLAREHGGMTHKLPAEARAQDYRQELVGPVRPALNALTASTALVWLIACFSVAGLLLTRYAAQRHELAIRATLGAGRTRLLRQLLAECVLLATAAAGCGWVLAAGGIALLRHYLQTHLPFGLNQIHLSASTLWGLAALSAASVLATGLLPAGLAAAAPPQSGLREAGTAASPSRASMRLRDGLVVTEIALALLLLCGASLILRTLHNLRSIPLGFATRNIITTPLHYLPGSFAHRDIVASFDRPLLERVHALPGVEAAALTTVIPLEHGFSAEISFGPHSAAPGMKAAVRVTSPEYTRVFAIPMLRGRFFNAQDTIHTPEVVVVNQALADKYFPGRTVVGRKVGHIEIIGVLANVHWAAPGIAPDPVVFFSSTQMAPGRMLYNIASMFSDLAVRTRTSPDTTIPELRQLLHQLAPNVAGTNFETMRQLVNDSMASQLFAARLLTLFGLAALAIALAGLYGLLAFTVAERHREMGIRLALGAQRGQITALVLRHALTLLAIGLTIGLTLSWQLGRLLASYLYGVHPHDAASLLAAVVILALCGLAAAWLPARRAARADPLESLRAE
ncbi:MAG: ADOP family duplicated permease [Terriglobales bacterium]